jgi:homoserine kinase
MRDIVIEPQRSHLIPGFAKLQAAAQDLEVLGFSISGSGPSVFAWARGKAAAAEIGAELIRIFADQGIAAESWVSPIAAPGARVIS